MSSESNKPASHVLFSLPLDELKRRITRDIDSSTRIVIQEANEALQTSQRVDSSKGVTVSEAASILGYSPATVRDMVADGFLESYQARKDGDIRIT